MSFLALLNDRCTILTRTVDKTGKEDTQSFTAQPTPTRCRAMKRASKRHTGTDGSGKIQYGTVVFTTFVLPKNATIAVHDRISHEGRTYGVMEVVRPRNARAVNHIVAVCDVVA